MPEAQPASGVVTAKPRPFRILRWLALRLGGLCSAVSLIFLGCADRLLLYPSRDAIAVPGAGRVHAQGPKGAVEIWTIRSEALPPGSEPAAFVLHFNGNGSRAEFEGPYVADQWRDQPVEVWAVNYPGYGASAGSAAMRSIPPAVLAAYDTLKQQAGSRPIFISGRSIGTTAALYVAAHRPVSGVILHSPPPLRQLILGNFGWWNLWIAAGPVALGVPGDLDSIANARQSSAPAVFIRSGNDQVVPGKYQQRVIDAYAGAKKVIDYAEATHNDPVEGAARVEFENDVKWLWHGTGGGR